MRMYLDISPCEGCNRVPDPDKCENKNCRLWQKWFFARWELLRAYPRRRMEQKPEPVGVILGGKYYAPPHMTRAYLEQDPCGGCMCSPELCRVPCRARQHWAKANGEVGQ